MNLDMLLYFSPPYVFFLDPPLPSWIWSFDDVISHDGKLWWVDLAMGLLACDPFADQPDVAYVPLPKAGEHGGGRHGCSYCSQRKRASRRSVQVSNGKFRCLEMSCPLQRQGSAPKFTMHTLADPEKAQWTPEYCVSFAEIWAGESYKAARLPKKEPLVPLITPRTPTSSTSSWRSTSSPSTCIPRWWRAKSTWSAPPVFSRGSCRPH